MFKKNYLTKKYLFDTYSNWDKDYVLANKENFVNFLNKIEQEFYTHDFKKDDRYVCATFHKGRLHEMHELYYPEDKVKELIPSLGDFTCPTKWCIWDLIDLLIYPTGFTSNFKRWGGIYANKTDEECRKIYDSYVKDGIVSLNERDIILHAINMLKDSLEKCNNDLEWNYESR